jgi:hypothetical protein
MYAKNMMARNGGPEEADAGVAVGCERRPVLRVHVKGANGDHEEDDGHLQDHHSGIEARAFPDALHQDRRDDAGDDDGGQIDDGPGQNVLAGLVQIVRSVLYSKGQPQPENADEVLEVLRPAMSHGRGCHRVFQYEIPSNDPREELAERRVGVRVRGPRHRDDGGKLRVAHCSKDAAYSRDDEGEHEGWTGRIMRGHAHEDEDPGPDDGADPEARELDRTEHPTQPVLSFQLLEEHLEGLSREEVTGH